MRTLEQTCPAPAAARTPREGRVLPPWRRRLLIALTLLGTTLAMALLAEAALRLNERRVLGSAMPSHWAGDYLAVLRATHQADRMFVRDPADPVVPYRNRPGFAMEFPVPSGETWRCRINSLGFRGPDFSPRKPPGAFRILCLGGSTTFWGYTDEETYPAKLEARLQEAFPGRRIEVLNLGVSGYTSAMSAERFRREYRDFEPDLVVVHHGCNDVTVLAPGRYRHRLGRSLFLATAWNLALAARQAGEGSGLAAAVEARFGAEIAPRYEALRAAAEAVGAPLLAVTYPGPELARLSPPERRFLEGELYRSWRELGSLEAYAAALDAYNRLVREWAARGGVAVADAARAVRGTTDLFMDIAHMNTAGIERLAEEVAAEVLRRGWISSAGASATAPGPARRPR